MYKKCIDIKFEKNNPLKMRLSILISVVVILSSENILAFAPSVSSRNGFFTLPISRTMRMSTTSESSVNIVVTGNNIAVTPALNTYVNKKLDNIISKLSSGGAVQECKVHLTVNKNPKVMRIQISLFHKIIQYLDNSATYRYFSNFVGCVKSTFLPPVHF